MQKTFHKKPFRKGSREKTKMHLESTPSKVTDCKLILKACTIVFASFPIGQFLLNGYSIPFRLDRNAHGGVILLYVREDISSKLLLVEENLI